MTNLTKKQIDNRRYYQERRESICASKREKYQSKKSGEPSVSLDGKDKEQKVKVVKQPIKKVIAKPVKSESIKVPSSHKTLVKTWFRRSIEDHLLAKELAISIADF